MESVNFYPTPRPTDSSADNNTVRRSPGVSTFADLLNASASDANRTNIETASVSPYLTVSNAANDPFGYLSDAATANLAELLGGTAVYETGLQAGTGPVAMSNYNQIRLSDGTLIGAGAAQYNIDLVGLERYKEQLAALQAENAATGYTDPALNVPNQSRFAPEMVGAGGAESQTAVADLTYATNTSIKLSAADLRHEAVSQIPHPVSVGPDTTVAMSAPPTIDDNVQFRPSLMITMPDLSIWTPPRDAST